MQTPSWADTRRFPRPPPPPLPSSFLFKPKTWLTWGFILAPWTPCKNLLLAACPDIFLCHGNYRWSCKHQALDRWLSFFPQIWPGEFAVDLPCGQLNHTGCQCCIYLAFAHFLCMYLACLGSSGHCSFWRYWQGLGSWEYNDLVMSSQFTTHKANVVQWWGS